MNFVGHLLYAKEGPADVGQGPGGKAQRDQPPVGVVLSLEKEHIATLYIGRPDDLFKASGERVRPLLSGAEPLSAEVKPYAVRVVLGASATADTRPRL